MEHTAITTEANLWRTLVKYYNNTIRKGSKHNASNSSEDSDQTAQTTTHSKCTVQLLVFP